MINILPFKQSDSSRCGPAVVKMILNYYGTDVTEDAVCKQCNHSYEKGCDDKGIIKAFKYFGLGSRIYNNATLKDIEYWMKHHIPVIVDWFAGGLGMDDIPNGHSSIVVDIDREMIYILDPATAQVLTVSREDFMRVWFDWKKDSYLNQKTLKKNMVLQQIIVPYPKRLDEYDKNKNRN